MGNLRWVRTTIVEDLDEAKVYVRSHIEGRKFKRAKKQLGDKLLGAYREIGTRSSDTEEAKRRRSFGSVKESEALLATRQEAVNQAEKQQEIVATRFAERETRRTAKIDRLKALVARHSSLHSEARRVLNGYEQEAKELRARLAKPAEPKPGEISQAGIGPRLVEIDDALPGAREAEAKARGELEAVEAELERERTGWSGELEDLQGAVQAAEQAVTLARAEHAEASSQHEGYLEELGKSIALAGFAAPQLKGSVDAARDLLRQIQECDATLSRHRSTAAAAKDGAIRLFSLAGAVLFLIGIVVVLLFAL